MSTVVYRILSCDCGPVIPLDPLHTHPSEVLMHHWCVKRLKARMDTFQENLISVSKRLNSVTFHFICYLNVVKEVWE